jgi:N-acetylglucosamine-6-sulfatase
VAERPSVVVIMTDDQTYADMAAMPRTRRLIGAAGARFTRSYVSYPLCCPSRATYLTGQFNHNNGVQTNSPPKGGVEALDAEHTLPVWLSAAGYRTSHIGKYLNGYGLRHKPTVPPGWTDWHGTVDKSTYQMYGY